MKYLNTYRIFESINKIPSIILNSILTIEVKYYGFDDQIHTGKIECNKKIADDLINIFNELLNIKFPIYQIYPISKYNYNDELSVRANNSSCFNFRVVAGTNKLSDHATGNAIDINPMENPWVHPSAIKIPGREYNLDKKGTIDKSVVDIFMKYGWTWGGNWKNPDYQHFFKPDPELKQLYFNSLDPIVESLLVEGVNFNKQPKKATAKTDVYNVSKGGKVIGQVKWVSRVRGYSFSPTKDCEDEIKEFIKDLMKKRRDEKKKSK